MRGGGGVFDAVLFCSFFLLVQKVYACVKVVLDVAVSGNVGIDDV